MQDIRDLDREQLLSFLKSNQEPAFRAKQILEWLWKKNVSCFEDMRNIPTSLQKKLADNFHLTKLQVVAEQKSIDKTLKYKLKLHDDNCIEMVLIPSGKRVTVCVSTQVGCALKCAFCATGTMGFVRNLSVYEMYEQVFLANELAKEKYNNKISNIVLMGMGEPLLNLDNVCQAVSWITESKGLGMSPSRITLSTAGIKEKIKDLADKNLGINFALSLHAANQSKRRQLMPVAENYSLSELSKDIVYYHTKTKQRISIEYLLLADVNDSLNDARDLALFCKSFPVKINIIEYNSHTNTPFRPASKERLEEFVNFLTSRNIIVQVRNSRGKDIDAACGQLGNNVVETNMKKHFFSLGNEGK
jgi:23S rRNA (adenine2503-C2)-methyltransferase